MPPSHINDGQASVFLTGKEVTELLRISRRTLDRYVAADRLQAVKLPTGHRRFRREDVEALLDGTTAA